MNNNLILTQISLEEMRRMFREEISVFLSNIPTNTSSNSSKDLLSLEEASIYLDLAHSTLYRLVHNREIPYMKRNRRLYFSKDELRQWVEEGRKSTGADLKAAAQAHIAQRHHLKKHS
ncbi:MAG: helix-turn-helix domain-containing protein [Candidatus Amoebophilus sp.]